MSFFDKIKQHLQADIEKNDPDFFRRNSGRKIAATILEPSEAEIKSKEAES